MDWNDCIIERKNLKGKIYNTYEKQALILDPLVFLAILTLHSILHCWIFQKDHQDAEYNTKEGISSSGDLILFPVPNYSGIEDGP